ncbi:hypothetical protein AAJCM20276_13280 [Acetobacter aceti]|uniref:Uncharacterized protein n=1 Tax=Acetobacter aceti TaxID=435 RepID=A0A6S6PNB8_ACEAC|nr:hypothetical protein AAJCM20276_13280 [Acetobacter aceti]
MIPVRPEQTLSSHTGTWLKQTEAASGRTGYASYSQRIMRLASGFAKSPSGMPGLTAMTVNGEVSLPDN